MLRDPNLLIPSELSEIRYSGHPDVNSDHSDRFINTRIKFLLTTIPVNRLTNIPIASVAANPRARPNCGKNVQLNGLNKMKQVSNVVKFASRIESHARPKPSSIATGHDLPERNSSLMRSNIRILLSTAMPIERIKPAMPGSVSVMGIIRNIA